MAFCTISEEYKVVDRLDNIVRAFPSFNEAMKFLETVDSSYSVISTVRHRHIPNNFINLHRTETLSCVTTPDYTLVPVDIT